MTSRPSSTRREFLSGQSAADALADLANRAADAVGGAGDAVDLPEPASTPYQIRLGRRAMACQFEVLLNVRQYADAATVAMEALDLIDELEEQMTVFRESSEIMEINRSATAGPVIVESRLFQLFELAVELHRQSGGAYDITSGPLTKIWGFYRRQGAVPTSDSLQAARKAVGSHLVALDAARQAIRFLAPGVELNLGSIGKGYALDRAAEVLNAAGIHDYLIHGGQSSLIARGSRAGTVGWPVGLGDPMRPGKSWATIFLRDRAMATSGAGYQFFRHQGQRYGHILDPRTGHPAEGVHSVSVLAPTAAEADALSTACYVLGPERAAELCQRRPQVGMLMICPTPGGSGMTVHRVNLRDDEIDLAPFS